MHEVNPCHVQTVSLGHCVWHTAPFTSTLAFCVWGRNKWVSSPRGSISANFTNAAICVPTCPLAVIVRRIISGVELREGDLSFHRTHVVKTSVATFFSLNVETGKCPVCSNSPFGFGACCFTGFLTEAIPRRRVWDERACMCVLAWLTRWECLALFLRPCPQSRVCECVCAQSNICVSEVLCFWVALLTWY